MGAKAKIYDSTQEIVERIAAEARSGDTILVMSNGGFEDIHQRILDTLK